MSDRGQQHRPAASPGAREPASGDPRYVGAGVEADREWARQRIQNHFSARTRDFVHPQHERPIQAKAADTGAWRSRLRGGPDAGLPRSGGAHLPGNVRERMESQLGADLSQVKIHTGSESQQAAGDLNARAMTIGNDVHFGSGEYAPGSKEGDRLLAHELTHAVQGQNAGVQRKAADDELAHEDAEHAGSEGAVSHPDQPAEKEADAVGDRVADKLHGDAKRESAQSKASPIAAKLNGTGRKIIYRAKTKKADAGFVLAVDSTGKVHGDLPPIAPPEWRREQLEVSRDQLQRSIQTRKAEQKLLGEHGPHRARIAEEEALLRSIVKRLGGS